LIPALFGGSSFCHAVRNGESIAGMDIGTALHLQFALSIILLVLLIRRYQGKWVMPNWLRNASASNLVWSTVVLAGVFVAAVMMDSNRPTVEWCGTLNEIQGFFPFGKAQGQNDNSFYIYEDF
jgi:hypothetical protein